MSDRNVVKEYPITADALFAAAGSGETGPWKRVRAAALVVGTTGCRAVVQQVVDRDGKQTGPRFRVLFRGLNQIPLVVRDEFDVLADADPGCDYCMVFDGTPEQLFGPRDRWQRVSVGRHTAENVQPLSFAEPIALPPAAFKRKRSPAQVTMAVILFTVGTLILYDLGVYFLYGGKATLSTAAGNWLAKSFWVVLLFGLFIGHLMGSAMDGLVTWRHLALLLTAMLVGYLCTVW